MFRIYILICLIGTFIVMTPNVSADQEFHYKFGSNNCASCGWFVVVDGVMGGRSTGQLSIEENSIVLSGDISLENRGGFSSIRTPFEDFDLSTFSSVELRYRSSGQSFALTLNKHKRFYLPRFKATLPATEGAWVNQQINMSDFIKTRLGKVVGGSPSQSDLSSIIRLGLISNDKKAGPFELEIEQIRFIALTPTGN